MKVPVSPKYPDSSRKEGIEGKVFVKAIISVRGDVVCAEIVKGLSDDEINSSALNAVLESKWTPAMQRGKKVEIGITIPITFKLN